MAMKFRGKMLSLLLVIALVPLLLSALLHRVSMRQLGSELAQDTRQFLGENAIEQLQSMVDNYSLLLDRDKSMLRLALDYQARAVERRLARPRPYTGPYYFVADFENPAALPPDSVLSDRHLRRTDNNGGLAPMDISFQNQVYHLAPGVSRAQVAKDMSLLATMPEAYRFVSRARPGLFHWQYTSLESGVHSSFPGHGWIPKDFDPRQRSWYRGALKNEVYRSVMIDASSRKLMMTVSRGVHDPRGQLVGVTAIDVVYDTAFTDWKLPPQWAAAADSMVVVHRPEKESSEQVLEIVVHNRYQGNFSNWKDLPETRYLTSPDKEMLEKVVADIAAGKSGVRRLPFQGEEALWAYGRQEPGRPVPVVILPYRLVVEKADEAESYVLAKIISGLQLTGVLLLGVVVWVVITAVFRARAVTRPVTSLAQAAERLARGDFDTTVDIRTGDELEELGDSFNRVGPQLRERQQMKQSLEVAREIQQLLLPEKIPQFPGLEIAGGISYCDETGGDYYDFLQLDDHRMGVVVGDVVGHGVGAALLMASVSGALRALATSRGDDLDRLFADLNIFLTEEVGDTRFMTLFYALFNTEEHNLCWISAGHGPIYRFSAADQAIEEIPVTGMPLGIMDDAVYSKTCSSSLQKGDLLAIGTDGVWEARNSEGEQYGEERFQQLLCDLAARPSEEIYQKVMQSVDDFRGEELQDDDITLVIIKATC